MTTVSDVLAWAVAFLKEGPSPDPVREARLLVALHLGLSPDRLTLLARDPVGAYDDDALTMALADRRFRQIPISHLLGHREFYGRQFEVTTDVLDPRPETETLIGAAITAPFETVLDIGTGSGAIVLTLLAERPDVHGWASDISTAALAVAERNADALGVSDRVTFERSDMFADVEPLAYDLIVSNPPYIAADEMAGLAAELSHEPRIALTDEADGLTFYRKIAAHAPTYLAPEGRVLVEIGPTQGPAVVQMFRDAGFTNVAILPDLDGRDRVIEAKYLKNR